MSHLNSNPDCIFCKIIAGEIPSSKIYDDEHVMAFLDLKPSSKGHALVVPKIHSATFLETSDEVLMRMIPIVKKIAAAVVVGTGASGFNLSVNNGSASGQVVFHLHFHIVPRYDNDGLKLFPQHESDGKTREELAAHIHSYLK